MLTSSRYGISYPNPDRSDTPDVPRDIGAVVSAVEQSAMYGQGLASARPVSTVGSPGKQGRFYLSTDTNVLSYDFGLGWIDIGGANIIGRGTSLPATPYDGQLFELVDSLTDPKYMWTFRYNANQTTAYKWEFFAGRPWTITAPLARWRIAGGYGDLSDNTPTLDVGPRFALPRQGAYFFEFGAHMIHQGLASGGTTQTLMTMSYYNGSGYTAFGGPAAFGQPDTAVGGPTREAGITMMTDAFTADNANKLDVKALYQQSGGYTSGLYFQNRYVRCWPYKVA